MNSDELGGALPEFGQVGVKRLGLRRGRDYILTIQFYLREQGRMRLNFNHAGTVPTTMLMRFLLAGFLLGPLAGCSSGEDEAAFVARPVEELYNDATKEAFAGNFRAAAPLFDKVELEHPYSVWATRSQIMAAYALYRDNQYVGAVNALDRFIELHPSHENVDYAYYLKGLCFYEQIVDVGREQKLTRQALDALTEVVKRFPNSTYARDARLKVDLARNHLASKEMNVGRFYLRRGQHLAAINRFRTVVRDYETTEQTPEALHRLTEAYMALGLTQEAEKTAAVLGHNYPGSAWYEDSYALLKTAQPSLSDPVTTKSKGLFGLGSGFF